MVRDPKIAASPDVTNCYESLEAIIKLLRVYSKHHRFSQLPCTFVHVLASAASVILMKRYIENTSWTDASIAKPLGLIQESLDAVAQTWPFANQIKRVINSAMKQQPQDNPQNESPQSFDLMTSFVTAGSNDGMQNEFGDFVEMDMDAYYFAEPLQWSNGAF